MLERPLNMWGAVGIGSDGSYFTSIHCFAHIEVSDGSDGWSAAAQGFLLGALHYFVGEVAAVELGDAGHDAVQKCPAGCGVDVLCDADQRRTRGLNGQGDLYVVCTAASQAVEFVHDDVGCRVRGEICQHPLQLWTIR